MQRSTPGSRYERAVIDLLRTRYACEVFVSETMDVKHKVDGEIRRIGATQLMKPVQVQLTKRVWHFGKLNAYMSSRWLNRDIVSLYVEVHDGVGPRETAEHLAWAAQATQELSPYGKLPIFGLSIADDDAFFFDPYARLRELAKELESPERLAALKSGAVRRFEEDGFWIVEESTNELYFAHYIDVFNGSLRRTLRGGVNGHWVRFLPVAPGRATDVRKPLPRSKSARKA